MLKVKDFSYMFKGCSSLKDIKALQNWNVSEGNNFTGMLIDCYSLSDISPLLKWNNLTNFRFITILSN